MNEDNPIGYISRQDFELLKDAGSVTLTILVKKRGINTIPIYTRPNRSTKYHNDNIRDEQKGK